MRSPHSGLRWRDRVHPLLCKMAYLAVVIDLCSSRVVGWALTDHMCRGLVIEAMRQVIALHIHTRGLIFHSHGRGECAAATSARCFSMSAQRLSPLQWRLQHPVPSQFPQQPHSSPLRERNRFFAPISLGSQIGVTGDFGELGNLQIRFAGGKNDGSSGNGLGGIPLETQKQAWNTIFPFDEWLCASRIATPFLNHFSETVCPKSKSAKVSLLTALSSV